MLKLLPYQPNLTQLNAELLGFFSRRVGAQAAEELTQETWLRLNTVNPECDSTQRYRAYLFTIARRLLIDRYRTQRRSAQLVAFDETDGHQAASDPEGELKARQIQALIAQTLAETKPEVRQVFHYRTRDGLSFKEIAQKQQVSVNTALGRMHHISKTLHAALRHAGWIGDSNEL